MGFDLLNEVREYFTPTTVRETASMLGEPEEATQQAFNGAVPAVLSGLVQQGSTDGGAGQLLNQLQGGSLAPETEPATERGQGMLISLFGNRLDALSNGISQFSGIRESSALRILGMIAPVAAGILGRHVQSTGMTASGLQLFLASQRDTISRALPTGLGSLLGLGGAPSHLREVLQPVEESTHDEALEAPRQVWTNPSEERESFSPPAGRAAASPQRTRVMPWLLAGLVALGGWLLLRHGGDTKQRTEVSSTRTTADQSTQQRERQAEGRPPATRPAQRPRTGANAQPAAPSAGLQQFTAAIESTDSQLPGKFVLDGLDFDADSARLATNGMRTTDELASTLKAHPSAKIRLEGYTDDTGADRDNVALSEQRATAVREQLLARGVDGWRVEAKGYGSSHPVAPNDTEAGRAQNRRTEVVLLSR